MTESNNIHHFSDPFIRNKKYPKAESIFSFNYKTIDEVKDNCIFVFDTPVLLYLYNARLSTIQSMQEIYHELISLNRMFVPAQVAREFADHKSDYLKEMQSIVFDKFEFSFPHFDSGLAQMPALLKSFPEYEDLERIERDINHELSNFRFKILFTEYQQKVNSLIESSQAWLYTDPITKIYKDLFKNQVVVELNNLKSREEDIEKEVKVRAEHRIPPIINTQMGDGGMGNYLTWLTMLQLGKDLDTNVVFVTSPGNTDWMTATNTKHGNSRQELAYEFTNVTKGRSFNVIKLSEILRMFQVDNSIIQDIETIERKESKQADTPLGIDWMLCTQQNLESTPDRSGVFLLMDQTRRIEHIAGTKSLSTDIQKTITEKEIDHDDEYYFGFHLIDDLGVVQVVEEQLRDKYGLK